MGVCVYIYIYIYIYMRIHIYVYIYIYVIRYMLNKLVVEESGKQPMAGAAALRATHSTHKG